MNIKKVSKKDLRDWACLRSELWPEVELAELISECEQLLDNKDTVCFVAASADDQLLGFIEAAVYREQSEPYCHVEGWFVSKALRGSGVGRLLFAAVEQWALHRAIAWLTSDTTAKYPISPRAHAAAGFKEAHQMRIFVKSLTP